MRKAIVCVGILAAFFAGGVSAAEKSSALPVVNGKEVIATVNETPIFLEEYNESLAALHGQGGGDDSAKKRGKIDYEAPLKRLIDIRLALIEAENIGLGELPEIKEQVNSFAQQGMQQLLLEKAVKDVKADKKEVDNLYKEEVRQYVLQSLKIGKEEDAKKLAEEIKAGKDFNMVAARAIGAGIAVGSVELEEHRQKDMLPQISEVLAKMKKGEVSPVIPIKDGFVLMKLKDVRYPEDPATRKAAEEESKKRQQFTAQGKYVESLVKKYTKVDEKLLKSLDYEAKEPGIEAMLKDKRVVATIKGEAPVTVGSLGEELQKKFYHGTDKLIGTGKMNKEKDNVLYKVLNRRVIAKEALVQGINKTAAYKDTVDEFRKSMVFGAFMTKVIMPNMKLEESDISQYYKEHPQEFVNPSMVRLKSLVFSEKEKADNALAKLRTGTDFKWLAANAAGQVDAKAVGVLQFGEKMLMVTMLPKGLEKDLAGAKKGDLKVYADESGHFYVLLVEEMVAQAPKPLEEVHDAIKEKVFKVKLQQAFDEMTAKLREAYPVKTYVDRLAILNSKK